MRLPDDLGKVKGDTFGGSNLARVIVPGGIARVLSDTFIGYVTTGSVVVKDDVGGSKLPTAAFIKYAGIIRLAVYSSGRRLRVGYCDGFGRSGSGFAFNTLAELREICIKERLRTRCNACVFPPGVRVGRLRLKQFMHCFLP